MRCSHGVLIGAAICMLCSPLEKPTAYQIHGDKPAIAALGTENHPHTPETSFLTWWDTGFALSAAPSGAVLVTEEGIPIVTESGVRILVEGSGFPVDDNGRKSYFKRYLNIDITEKPN